MLIINLLASTHSESAAAAKFFMGIMLMILVGVIIWIVVIVMGFLGGLFRGKDRGRKSDYDPNEKDYGNSD